MIRRWLMLALLGTTSLIAREKPPLVTFGLGWFNIFRQHDVYQFSIEYLFSKELLKARPFLGGFATTQGASYLYGGFGWDIYAFDKIILTPTFALGWWQSGSGKNLYYPLEFRSSLALAFLLPDKSRIGIQFYHISNAHLGRRNPGEESLVLFYSLSL